MTYMTDYRENYIPKQSDLGNKVPNDNYNSNFRLGDMKPDFGTTSGNAYKFDPDAARNAKNGLDKDLINDLKSTHYKLGYDNDIGTTTQKKDYVPYDLNDNNLGKNLNGNNFNLGDGKKFDGISIYKSDYVEKEIPDNGNDCWC